MYLETTRSFSGSPLSEQGLDQITYGGESEEVLEELDWQDLPFSGGFPLSSSSSSAGRSRRERYSSIKLSRLDRRSTFSFSSIPLFYRGVFLLPSTTEVVAS